MRSTILAIVLTIALPALAFAEAGADDASMDTMEKAGTTASAEMEMEKKAAAMPVLEPLSPSAVRRGVFSTAIESREPVDDLDSLGTDHDQVFYFTEFVGVEGRQLTHRWEFGGEVMAEIPIAVNGPRWRAYSSKNLDAGWTGTWTVSVVDETGKVVRSDSFSYEAPKPVAEAEPSDEMAAPAAPASDGMTGSGDSAQP